MGRYRIHNQARQGVFVFVLLIFNKGAYLTFISIFLKALIFFYSLSVKSRSNPYVTHSVLSDEGKVSSSRKQQEPLVE